MDGVLAVTARATAVTARSTAAKSSRTMVEDGQEERRGESERLGRRLASEGTALGTDCRHSRPGPAWLGWRHDGSYMHLIRRAGAFAAGSGQRAAGKVQGCLASPRAGTSRRGCGRIYPNSYRRRNWWPSLGESEGDCPAAVWLDKAGRPCRNRGMPPEGTCDLAPSTVLICVTVAHGTCLGRAAARRAEKQCGTTDHDVQRAAILGPAGGRCTLRR
jgi:hypothetical protein